MKKFIVKILIFIIPLILFFGLPCFYLIKYDENFNNLNSFPFKQKNTLIGYKYNETNYDYLKWKAVNSETRYSVLALGSSRVLQFRKEMFNKSFYNAGFTVGRLNEFLPFLKSLKKENRPEFLIISLDQWMFNYNWDKLELQQNTNKWENAFRFTPSLSVINTTWKDIFDGKFSEIEKSSCKGYKKIGLNAYINDTGFRDDGSFYYGKQISKRLNNDPKMADYKFKTTLERINKGVSRFEYGNTVNPKAILELEKLLVYCKENKIHLIAFLPPFSDDVYRHMTEKKKYGYIDGIYSEINPLFNKFEMELYNFTNLLSCGSNDNEVIDGFHGGEVTYLKILIEMLEKQSILNNVSNRNNRKIELKKRINNYTVYKNYNCTDKN